MSFPLVRLKCLSWLVDLMLAEGETPFGSIVIVNKSCTVFEREVPSLTLDLAGVLN